MNLITLYIIVILKPLIMLPLASTQLILFVQVTFFAYVVHITMTNQSDKKIQYELYRDGWSQDLVSTVKSLSCLSWLHKYLAFLLITYNTFYYYYIVLWSHCNNLLVVLLLPMMKFLLLHGSFPLSIPRGTLKFHSNLSTWHQS